MTATTLAQDLVRYGQSLYTRGYSPGSSGNLSVKRSDGYLMTPTKSTLGMLDATRLSRIDRNGNHRAGDPPTKEAWVHFAYYQNNPDANAIVHLHSPFCMAVSCLENLDPDNVLPALTPYYVMRIGRLCLLPYFRPGDKALAEAVGAKAASYKAMLLAHHGFIVCGADLDKAVARAEELEETAKLFMLLQGKPYRSLSSMQIQELIAS